MTGDTNDKCAKQQRGNDDLDEAEKNGAEKLKAEGQRWSVVAEFRARKEAHKDPSGQRAPRRRRDGHQEDGEPAQERRQTSTNAVDV